MDNKPVARSGNLGYPPFMAQKRPFSVSPAALRDRPASRPTRDRIIDAALGALRDTRPEDFSVREVAKRLAACLTSLYWHLGGGRDLLPAAVAGTVLKNLLLPLRKGGDARQDWLCTLSHRYRAAVDRHPRLGTVLGSQPVSNAGADLSLFGALLALLLMAGFRSQAPANACNATVATTLGVTPREFAVLPAEDPADWERMLLVQIEDADRDAHPMAAVHLSLLLSRAVIQRWRSGDNVSQDAAFDIYVETFLRGFVLPRAG